MAKDDWKMEALEHALCTRSGTAQESHAQDYVARTVDKVAT